MSQEQIPPTNSPPSTSVAPELPSSSLLGHCQKTAIQQLHTLPEEELAGLIESYMEKYPERAVGHRHSAVLHCSYPYGSPGFSPEDIEIESFYLAVLRIFEELEKATPEVKSLLMTKVRHHIVYSQLYDCLEYSDYEKIAELQLPPNEVWPEFGLSYVEDEMLDYSRDGKLPSIGDTVTLLREYIRMGTLQNHPMVSRTEEMDYHMIFGMGFSLKQSEAFITLLRAAGEIPTKNSGTISIKRMFSIEKIPRGTFVTITYGTDGFSVNCVDFGSNHGRGLDSTVDDLFDHIYWYHFM